MLSVSLIVHVVNVNNKNNKDLGHNYLLRIYCEQFIHSRWVCVQPVALRAGGPARSVMPIVWPGAHKLNPNTGEYDATDEQTSGGDIGAQVPLFPVVWVSCHRSVCTCSH